MVLSVQLLLFDGSCGRTGAAAAAARLGRLVIAVKRPLRLNFQPVLQALLRSSLRASGFTWLFFRNSGDPTPKRSLETSFQSIEPFSTAPRDLCGQRSSCTAGSGSGIYVGTETHATSKPTDGCGK